jgi:hypothetical protein
MDNLFSQKIINANNLFGDSFLDAKTLYLYCFNALPSLHYISGINGEKVFNAFLEKYKHLIKDTHQYTWYISKRKKNEFDRAIVILTNNCILQIDETFCDIFYDGKEQDFIKEVTIFISQFKKRQRKQPLEINLVVQKRGKMELQSMEIKKTKLDLDLFYEDDFKPIDEVIRTRLGKKNDKGIVLLHGLPGAGKTTYLRYLVGKIKKPVLFLSPNVAGDLMDPSFIELLIDNPNSVLIIEDAENIIMDRKTNNSSSVSNLLNISDGLLADFLNVQIICTFNSSLTLIDSALMRKGRLIAKYEFGKLSVEKAQRLSNHLGHNKIISAPMTVAEISNPHEQHFESKRVEVMGFRRNAAREEIMMS